MKTLDHFNFKNKTAIIRVDFNVPLNEQLEVTDANRIEAAKDTVSKILNDGGKVVLMSHLGRPKGGYEAKYSLKNILSKVEDVLKVKVHFAEDCIGQNNESFIKNIPFGEVILLENLRFWPEEEKGDVAFAEKLSKYGDIYVNDAFGTAHRAHASTTIIAQFFHENKCFGYLLAKEIESIERVLKNSEKPVTAILGGSKVSIICNTRVGLDIIISLLAGLFNVLFTFFWLSEF